MPSIERTGRQTTTLDEPLSVETLPPSAVTSSSSSENLVCQFEAPAAPWPDETPPNDAWSGETFAAASLQYAMSSLGLTDLANAPVPEWSLTHKLGAALDATAKHLGPEVVAKVKSLTSPESLAAMKVAGTAWLGSHAFGVGESVDVFMGAVGIASMGGEAITVGRELFDFAELTVTAKSEKDLDAAGAHLARAIAIVGTDVVVAFVTHKAASAVKSAVVNLPPPSGGLVPATGAFETSASAISSPVAATAIPIAVGVGTDVFAVHGPDSSLEPLSDVSAASMKQASRLLTAEAYEVKLKALPRIEATRNRLIARLDALLENPNLSQRSRSSLSRARNVLNHHLKQDDLTGALRDNLGIPVRKVGSGQPFQHITEVREATPPIGDAIGSLQADFRRGLSVGTPNTELSLLADALQTLKSQIDNFVTVTQ